MCPPFYIGFDIKIILMSEPYILLAGMSRQVGRDREGHEQPARGFSALRAVPAADTAVPSRDERDATVAGPCRSPVVRAARAPAYRSARTAARRPGHRRRTGFPPGPDPAHRQRRARRPGPRGIRGTPPRPGRPAAHHRADP